MGGSFACPECGNALALKGTSPGRQVRCSWCETWVEVPFLPRAAGSRSRHSRRRPRWVIWAWVGLGLAACLILVVGTGRMIRTRGRGRHEQAVAELVDLAEADEKAGLNERALEEFARAIKEAGKSDPPRPDRLAALQRRRDRLARSHAEARLEAAARAEPAAAIAVYKDVLSHGWSDPALEGLEGPVRARLEETRRKWAESDVAAARRAIDLGRPNEAIDLCERLVRTAEELPPDLQVPFRSQANALVAGLIEQRGLLFRSPQGQFTLGTPGAYQAKVDPLLDQAFRQRGYVPRRSISAWKTLWDDRAPFQVMIEVTERQEGSYMQSQHRLSFLTFTMTLRRGETQVWRVGPITARTQPSIPSMSAFTASRLATDERRSGEFERLLYDDARTILIDRINQRLKLVPEFRPAAG